MLMLPWFSSMQERKLRTSVSQAGFSHEVLAALLWYRPLSMAWPWAGAWDWASAGALEPPPKKPPIAWPMEDPTATPLGKKYSQSHMFGKGSGSASEYGRGAEWNGVE